MFVPLPLLIAHMEAVIGPSYTAGLITKVSSFMLLLLLLVDVAPLLRGRPALVGPLLFLLILLLLLRIEKRIIQLLLEALVGAGLSLLLEGLQLQCAVPYTVAAVDQKTCREKKNQQQIPQRVWPPAHLPTTWQQGSKAHCWHRRAVKENIFFIC